MWDLLDDVVDELLSGPQTLPFWPRLLADGLAESLDECSRVHPAIFMCRVARIVKQVRTSDGPAQHRELLVRLQEVEDYPSPVGSFVIVAKGVRGRLTRVARPVGSLSEQCQSDSEV